MVYFFYNFIHKKYIYFSIYSIKHENAFFCVLSYGYPMGMLWLSYGNKSQLPYNTQYSLLIYESITSQLPYLAYFYIVFFVFVLLLFWDSFLRLLCCLIIKNYRFWLKK